MKKLGRVQAGVLRSLREHGAWSRGCGWIWSTTNQTEKVLKDLVARGLVQVTERKVPATKLSSAYTYKVYQIIEVR